MELFVSPDKELHLKNIVFQSATIISDKKIDSIMERFQNDIIQYNIKTYGPLVIKHTDSSDKGFFELNIEIIQQTYKHLIFRHPYLKSRDTEICKNCVYIATTGNFIDLFYAMNKLDLYIYENNLISTGITYTFFHRDRFMEIYKQVEKRPHL